MRKPTEVDVDHALLDLIKASLNYASATFQAEDWAHYSDHIVYTEEGVKVSAREFVRLLEEIGEK